MEECRCHHGHHCHSVATHTWALVPLCQEHFETVKKETELYYKKRIAYAARLTYLSIIHLIPWSRKEWGYAIRRD
ncbi:hypothetical protein [Paenibacillus pseudetheri]|uniref:Uncharacterized protein n=1 Tax=Paenibacillus pseudetheri TaxID=2897682 RepID=A0ABM9B6D5_9BACL|nr:hypothetical protein [Paenibacillus pseudetheri]CAH1054069.1 hypothetical protein PAECIP111894_00214 [Paenibacillus pseudetheri]